MFDVSSFLRQVNTASSLFKEILYPRKCSVCKKEIEEGIFCEKCRASYWLRKSIRFTPENHLIAGLPYAAKDVLDGVIFLYRYDAVIKDMLHEIKFADKYEFLPWLREEVDKSFTGNLELWLAGFDIITSIPTSKERLTRRGFDVPQELFAKIFAHEKYEPELLVRARNTVPLFELAPDVRRSELAGCFCLQEKMNVKDRCVLICDDIYTSGSTLAEAAICLKMAGAKKVYALTFAAARENWEMN